MYSSLFPDSDIKHHVKNVIHSSKSTNFYVSAYFFQTFPVISFGKRVSLSVGYPENTA